MEDYIQSVLALFQQNYKIPFDEHSPVEYLIEQKEESLSSLNDL